MEFRDGAEVIEFIAGRFDPSGRSERSMIGGAEDMARADVSVEEAPVVDDASNQLDIVMMGRGKD